MKMDNILKVLLGVLGIAGLLALLTPTTMTVTPNVPKRFVEVAQPVSELTEGSLDEAFVQEADYELVKFGDPMIDGKPIGDEEAPQQQVIDNADQSQLTDNSGIKIDYQQILDNAAQGRYGMPPFEPTILTANVDQTIDLEKFRD